MAVTVIFHVLITPLPYTFISCLDEDRFLVVDHVQADVIVVDDVPRVVEPVVRPDEVVHVSYHDAEGVVRDDVNHVSRLVEESLVFPGLAYPGRRPVQLPHHGLDGGEDQTEDLVER